MGTFNTNGLSQLNNKEAMERPTHSDRITCCTNVIENEEEWECLWRWMPKTVREAVDKDKENGNTLWQDSIREEMENVMVAFVPLKEGEKVPAGSEYMDWSSILSWRCLDRNGWNEVTHTNRSIYFEAERKMIVATSANRWQHYHQHYHQRDVNPMDPLIEQREPGVELYKEDVANNWYVRWIVHDLLANIPILFSVIRF